MKFVQARFADPKVGFLTVCIGSIALAPTGILNHLHVASNKKVLNTSRSLDSWTITYTGWVTGSG